MRKRISYSNIAPMSWLIQRDVEEGRQHLNFSEWGSGREGEEGDEVAKVFKTLGSRPKIWDAPVRMSRLTDKLVGSIIFR